MGLIDEWNDGYLYEIRGKLASGGAVVFYIHRPATHSHARKLFDDLVREASLGKMVGEEVDCLAVPEGLNDRLVSAQIFRMRCRD